MPGKSSSTELTSYWKHRRKPRRNAERLPVRSRSAFDVTVLTGCAPFFGQAATRKALQSKKSAQQCLQCSISRRAEHWHAFSTSGTSPFSKNPHGRPLAARPRPCNGFRRVLRFRLRSLPALDMPCRTCGMIGTQQMEDCSLEHPAAGQAATRPAWRKPGPPQRDRQRATTGAARERHPGSGERRPADAVQPRHSWGTGEVCPT